MAVLQDDALNARLGRAARDTALRYDLGRVADSLEELLYSAVAAGRELLGLRTHPLVATAAHRACVEAIGAAAVDARSMEQGIGRQAEEGW